MYKQIKLVERVMSHIKLSLVLFLMIECVHSTEFTFQNVTGTLKTFNGSSSDVTNNMFVVSSKSINEFLNGSRVDVILIRKQTIPVLYSGSLANLIKIRKLVLTGNHIGRIVPHALTNSTRILELDLSNNLLSEIQKGVFNNVGVKRLFLNHNKIRTIESQAFANMTILQVIELKHNRITMWQLNWFVGSPVRHLDFGYNSLEELPKGSFNYYQQFTQASKGEFFFIGLNHNQIRYLDSGALPNISTLWFLSLEYNRLERISDETFLLIERLEELKLGHNLLKKFPQHLLAVTDVKYLKLNNNLIKCIDVNITEILNVDENPLKLKCKEEWEKRKQRDLHLFKNYFNVTIDPLNRKENSGE